MGILCFNVSLSAYDHDCRECTLLHFFCRGASPTLTLSRPPFWQRFRRRRRPFIIPALTSQKRREGGRCLIARGERRILSLSDTLPGGREKGRKEEALSDFPPPTTTFPFDSSPEETQERGNRQRDSWGIFFGMKNVGAERLI